MPKVIANCLISFLILSTYSFLVTNTVNAATCDPKIATGNAVVPNVIYTGQDLDITIPVDPSIMQPGDQYTLLLTSGDPALSWDITSDSLTPDVENLIKTGSNTLIFHFQGSKVLRPYDKYIIRLKRNSRGVIGNTIGRYVEICNNLGTANIIDNDFQKIGTSCKISVPDNIKKDDKQNYKFTYSVPDIQDIEFATIIINPSRSNLQPIPTYYRTTARELIRVAYLYNYLRWGGITWGTLKPSETTFDFSSASLDYGEYAISINAWKTIGDFQTGYYNHGFSCAYKIFKVSNLDTTQTSEGISQQANQLTGQQSFLQAQSCNPSAAPGTANSCSKAAGIRCDPQTGKTPDNSLTEPNSSNSREGRTSSQQIDRYTGIYTAIGCIPTEPKALVEGIIKFVSLAAGGIAFLVMVFGAFRMMTALGNPDNVKAGRDQIVAAVYGLLFIIFSVVLLQVIGVDILGIPGFTR